MTTAAGIPTTLLVEMRRMLRHQLARGAVCLAVSQYIVLGLNFTMTVVAARLLGPTDYGIAALVMAYPALLRSFIDFKSKEVTTRYIANFRATGRSEELKSICKLGYIVDFTAAFGAFVLIGASFWWVAQHILETPGITWIGIAYAASFPILGLRKTSGAILTSWQRFAQLAICQILTEGIAVIIVLTFVLAGLGVTGLILGIALGQVIIGLTMLGAAFHVLHDDGLDRWWEAPLATVAPLRKELTAFFGWNYLLVTVSGVMTQGPLMLLGRLRGPEEAGFYRLAMSLMTAASDLGTSPGRVTYPILSARWALGEQESLSRTLKRWTLRGGLPGGAFILLAIPFLPLVVPVAFGPAYIPMVWGAQMMILAATVSTVFFWLKSFYYATGRVDIWTKAYSLYTAFIIGLGWVCIQMGGFSWLASLITVGAVLFTVSMVVVAMSTWRRLK